MKENIKVCAIILNPLKKVQENDFFLNLSSPLVNYFLIQFVFHNFNRLVLNLLFHQLFMLIELKKKNIF